MIAEVAFALYVLAIFLGGMAVLAIILHLRRSQKDRLARLDVDLWVVGFNPGHPKTQVRGSAYGSAVMLTESDGVWNFHIGSSVRTPGSDAPLVSAECPVGMSATAALLLARGLCEAYLAPKEV